MRKKRNVANWMEEREREAVKMKREGVTHHDRIPVKEQKKNMIRKYPKEKGSWHMRRGKEGEIL